MYSCPGKYSEEVHDESSAGLAGSSGVYFRRALPSGDLPGSWTSAFFRRLGLDLVDLAVRRRRGEDHPAWADLECLHLEFLRLKNNRRVPSGPNAVNARRDPVAA